MKLGLALAQRDDRWVDPVIDALVRPDDPELRDIALATAKIMIENRVYPYITMTVLALIGESDRVMEIAMQIAESETGTFYEIEIIYLSEFKMLREHEEFPRLLQALGLTDYWNSIGCRWSNDRVNCNAS